MKRILIAVTLFATLLPAQQKKITLLIWSSTWNGLIKPLAEQFTKDTGIAVDIEVQASSMEGLVKVQAMRGKPTADAARKAARRALLRLAEEMKL